MINLRNQNMFILFLALFAILQVANSGLFSVAQSNIVSNCYYSMSVDNIWLAESCNKSATNMYKFNGTAFNKLPYTIPLSPIFGIDIQISVNAYGNFIAQTNFTILLAYKFNDTAATLVLNKTYSGYYDVTISMATRGTTIMYATQPSTGTAAVIGFLKYNGTNYVNYGSTTTFLNLFQWFFKMSQFGTMSAFFQTNSGNSHYTRFYYDSGSGFSTKSSLYSPTIYYSSPYVLQGYFWYDNTVISPDGSYYAYLEKPLIYINIIFRTYNLTLYANVTTTLSYQLAGSALSMRFIRNGSTDYLYLIQRNSSITIYQNTGSGFALFDTVNIATNLAHVEVASGLTYFYLNTPNVAGATYLYVYCNVANCQTCSTPGQCGACVAGTTLYTNICYTCNIPQCNLCVATNVCVNCSSGYSLSSNACAITSKLSITSQSTDASSSTSNSVILIGLEVTAVFLVIVGLALLLMKIKNIFATKQAISEPKATEFNEINNESKVGQNLIEKVIQ